MGLVPVNMSPDMSRGAFTLYSIVCKTRWSVMAINKAPESSCSPVSENLDRRASDSRIRVYGITVAVFAVCEIVAAFERESNSQRAEHTRSVCIGRASTRSPINHRPRVETTSNVSRVFPRYKSRRFERSRNNGDGV